MGGKNDSYSFWEVIFFQQNRMKKTKTFFFVILNLIYLHIMWHARYRVIRAFLQKIVFENKIIVVQFLKINKNNVFFWCERFKNVSLEQKKPSTWPTKTCKTKTSPFISNVVRERRDRLRSLISIECDTIWLLLCDSHVSIFP